MRVKILFYIGLVLVLFSCSPKANDKRIEKAFQDLATRYSILKFPQDSSYTDYYTLLTSIEYHFKNINYHIFRRSNNEEKIYVLTIEYRNKISAIPIFDFSQSCYWNYENEQNKCDSSKYNFQYEYNRMLNDLSLNDSLRLASSPYGVLANDILYLETVRLQDTVFFKEPCSYYDIDSIFITNRNIKNAGQLIKLMHPKDYIYNYSGLKDRDVEHVIWAEFKKKSDKKFELLFKAFNFECEEMPSLDL